MSDFIQNLLTRHLEPAGNVQPRLRGMFEPVPNSPNLSIPGFSKNTGEQEEQREGNYMNNPAGVDRYAAVLPGSFSNIPAVLERSPEISPVNFRQLPHPLTAFPEKHPGVFQTNADSPAPAPLVNHISEPPRFLPEPVKPRNPETAGEVGTAKPSLPNRGTEPAKQAASPLRVASGVQPAFAAAEKSPFPTTGSQPGDTTQRRGGAGGFPEGFNRRFRPETLMQPAPAPVIKVNIGRIEVRAMMQQTASPAASKAPAMPKPRLTLEDYLKK